MGRQKQEWDYPARREPRRYRVLDAEPEGEGWSSPAVTRFANGYWGFVKVVFGAVVGAVIAGVIVLTVMLIKS